MAGAGVIRAPLAALVLVLAGPVGVPRPAATARGDDRAIEIALGALDAVEEGWALDRYDRASRVRASVNLRGSGGSGGEVGVTANVVVDRPNRRWRVDASGDVGPLTLIGDPRRLALSAPALAQHASRSAAGLGLPSVGGGPAAAVEETRRRLRNGYGALADLGDDVLDGVPVHRIRDVPEPGTTATYWIDARTDLPLRVAIDRPGRRDARVDFSYGSGPRPTRVDAYLQGERDARIVATPRYGADGRVERLHLELTPAGGGRYAADLVLDWSPRLADGFFRLQPAAGSTEVPFGQLAAGVLFTVAGRLGGLLPALTGGR